LSAIDTQRVGVVLIEPKVDDIKNRNKCQRSVKSTNSIGQNKLFLPRGLDDHSAKSPS
jgi:hypothetical protein